MSSNDLWRGLLYALCMLDVRRLRVLREVAVQGSFSAAADALAFTQPAVSRQIATLEAEAGTLLVERGARGIRLTPAGELLVETAETVLDKLAAAEHQLEALAGLHGGRLRVGAFPSANATLIPLALSAFDRAHPDVCLSLVEARSPECAALLGSGELDIAVVSDSEGDLGDELELEPLMDDPMFLAVARDHPLADRDEVTMADLRDEVWIEGRGNIVSHALRAAAARAGFEPRIGFESTQWLGKQGLVAAGVGITLIPTVALAAVHDDIVLRSLGPDAPMRRLSIATSASRYRAPGVEPMKDVLREVAREHSFACDALVK
jgi:DNA-binding transcriptional LysR family regulator